MEGMNNQETHKADIGFKAGQFPVGRRLFSSALKYFSFKRNVRDKLGLIQFKLCD